MNCDKCNSDRIVNIDSKCSDCCFLSYKEYENDGYVPDEIGIGGGDYVAFSFCLDCGKIQGDFPVDDNSLMEFIKESRGYDELF